MKVIGINMTFSLSKLTKQKFERMGYSFHNKKHNGVDTSYFSCQKNMPHDFGTEIYINEAQLITLDSEIEKLEFAEEEFIDFLDAYDDNSLAPIKRFHKEQMYNLLKKYNKQLTELKKMRNNIK